MKKHIIVDRQTGEVVDRLPELRDARCSRYRVMIVNDEPSSTLQDPEGITNINNIVKRYQKTGELPIAHHNPIYADVTHLQGDATEAYVIAEEVISRYDSDTKEAAKAKAKREKASNQAAATANQVAQGATETTSTPQTPTSKGAE